MLRFGARERPSVGAHVGVARPLLREASQLLGQQRVAKARSLASRSWSESSTAQRTARSRALCAQMRPSTSALAGGKVLCSFRDESRSSRVAVGALRQRLAGR